MRVVIAGGGTGGHLFPGIAVAQELIARLPGTVISFAGTGQGIEAKVLPHEGFALGLIRSGGIKGKSIAGRARAIKAEPAARVLATDTLSIRATISSIGSGRP